MKDIDKMSSNELRAEVRVLRPVYEAAEVALHSDVIGSNTENIERLAETIAAVDALDENGAES